VTREDIDAWIMKRCGETTTVRTHYSVRRIGNLIGDSLGGAVSFQSLENLRRIILQKYRPQESISKCFIASRNFLLFMESSRFDPAFGMFAKYFRTPLRAGIKPGLPPIIPLSTINQIMDRISSDFRSSLDHKR